MGKYSDIKKELSSRSNIERELHLKQLQINRLLNITQAINNNLSSGDLFKMYNSFLSWEMGVKKMALYIKMEDRWVCASHIGLGDDELQTDVSQEFHRFDRLKNLQDEDHPFLQLFDIVIPVKHKQQPIAYTFIDGLEESEDLYNRIQFIITITNVIAVAIENKRLFNRQLEQERLRRELELASDMQKMLIPTELPDGNPYELASIYIPQIGVGGDYFDFIPIDDDRSVFCVADISGKGVAAALLMANFQANLRSLLNMPYDLAECIRALNQAVYRITKGDRFITFFIAMYDKHSHEINYINAGHMPPVMYTGKELISLDQGCTILGSFVELPTVEVGHLTIREDATIVAFTDGLTDLKNADGDLFDETLIEDYLKKHHGENARMFNAGLLDKIQSFRGSVDFPDDITVLTCKIANEDRDTEKK